MCVCGNEEVLNKGHEEKYLMKEIEKEIENLFIFETKLNTFYIFRKRISTSTEEHTISSVSAKLDEQKQTEGNSLICLLEATERVQLQG